MSFSNEVLTIICNNLTRRDLKAVRQASRSLAEIAASALFTKLVFDVALRERQSIPDLCRYNVRELIVYASDTVSDGGTNRMLRQIPHHQLWELRLLVPGMTYNHLRLLFDNQKRIRRLTLPVQMERDTLEQIELPRELQHLTLRGQEPPSPPSTHQGQGTGVPWDHFIHSLLSLRRSDAGYNSILLRRLNLCQVDLTHVGSMTGVSDVLNQLDILHLAECPGMSRFLNDICSGLDEDWGLKQLDLYDVTDGEVFDARAIGLLLDKSHRLTRLSIIHCRLQLGEDFAQFNHPLLDIDKLVGLTNLRDLTFRSLSTTLGNRRFAYSYLSTPTECETEVTWKIEDFAKLVDHLPDLRSLHCQLPGGANDPNGFIDDLAASALSILAKLRFLKELQIPFYMRGRSGHSAYGTAMRLLHGTIEGDNPVHRDKSSNRLTSHMLGGKNLWDQTWKEQQGFSAANRKLCKIADVDKSSEETDAIDVIMGH
ncbi:Hypothetical protein D9617_51g089050 [Elsinoe fawcettii]|nr:Hypothetical protein D9617_51g089050 [Elsinoe fawcettii]